MEQLNAFPIDSKQKTFDEIQQLLISAVFSTFHRHSVEQFREIVDWCKKNPEHKEFSELVKDVCDEAFVAINFYKEGRFSKYIDRLISATGKEDVIEHRLVVAMINNGKLPYWVSFTRRDLFQQLIQAMDHGISSREMSYIQAKFFNGDVDFTDKELDVLRVVFKVYETREVSQKESWKLQDLLEQTVKGFYLISRADQ